MADFSFVDQIVHDIKIIKIQGATNIAKSAFKILIDELERQTFSDVLDFEEFLYSSMEKLEAARPTEPMLFNGMSYIYYQMDHFCTQKTTERDVKEMQKVAKEAASKYLELINETAERAIVWGLDTIKEGDTVLTHCHSGSAVKTIKIHKTKGINFQVYNTETRPLFQGRLTSKDLIDAGIPTTMIPDGCAPFLMDETSGTDIMIDCVIIGCDAIKLDGSVVNKVGSYSIGLGALYANVPMYIAGNLLKIDIHDDIHIEKRKSEEIWEGAPESLKLLNFAFDKVPSKFIRGIITEFGILKPRELEEIVKERYPWMKHKRRDPRKMK